MQIHLASSTVLQVAIGAAVSGVSMEVFRAQHTVSRKVRDEATNEVGKTTWQLLRGPKSLHCGLKAQAVTLKFFQDALKRSSRGTSGPLRAPRRASPETLLRGIGRRGGRRQRPKAQSATNTATRQKSDARSPRSTISSQSRRSGDPRTVRARQHIMDENETVLADFCCPLTIKSSSHSAGQAGQGDSGPVRSSTRFRGHHAPDDPTARSVGLPGVRGWCGLRGVRLGEASSSKPFFAGTRGNVCVMNSIHRDRLRTVDSAWYSTAMRQPPVQTQRVGFLRVSLIGRRKKGDVSASVGAPPSLRGHTGQGVSLAVASLEVHPSIFEHGANVMQLVSHILKGPHRAAMRVALQEATITREPGSAVNPRLEVVFVAPTKDASPTRQRRTSFQSRG